MRNVVILGAGASIQAFPQGDSNARKLPDMGNLVELVGISDELRKLGVSELSDNFETIYSLLCSEPKKRDGLDVIEQKVHKYFSEMQLPQSPTLYDHLLLSLRPHDLVATFNWDPFLFDSHERLAEKFDLEKLPSIAYLHGNVRVGYCTEGKVYDRIGRVCPHCDKPLEPCPLLYPIENKNYDKDAFISNAWQMLRTGLQDAFSITIFGYSAPVSDSAAIDIMKAAWKHAGERKLETMFIIDKKLESELVNTWRQFLFSQHFKVEKDFYQSWIPSYARRSIEALIVPTLEGKFYDDLPIPKNANWLQLYDWYRNLIKYE